MNNSFEQRTYKYSIFVLWLIITFFSSQMYFDTKESNIRIRVIENKLNSIFEEQKEFKVELKLIQNYSYENRERIIKIEK